jgi:hypothetical protein
MTTKSKKQAAKPIVPPKTKPITLPDENRKALPIPAANEDEARKKIAELYLLPHLYAARVVLAYNPKSSLDLVAVAKKMQEHAKEVNNGDLLQAEAMLINQAQALQAIFVNLAERAKNQEGLAQIQTLMSLSLKAQSQCRATLQTLVDVKYPRQATFIKQANIANQQQVNNGIPPPVEPSREEKPVTANELLEDQHGKRMDAGKTSTASSADPQLETVGAIHRA